MNDTGELKIKNKLGEGNAFKISRFKEYIKKTVPHRHDNYHEFIFLHEGKGFHAIEEKQYVVSAPESYYLQPGQLHFWQFTAIPKGYVVLFSPAFLEGIDHLNIKKMLLRLSRHRRIPLTPDVYPHRILAELYDTYKKGGDYAELIIKGQLLSLAGRLLAVAGTNPATEQQVSSPFERFQSLLVMHASTLRKVKEYAFLMHVTPTYLNRLCKKVDGRPAAEIINQQVMLEIKRYLLHTDLSLKEISEHMKFSDVSNFVKYFKGTEGCTPVQFRKKILNPTI